MSDAAGESTLHVEIHRAGHLVADADVLDDPATGLHGELHSVGVAAPVGSGASLVDEIDRASTAVPGSAVVLELPAGSPEMLTRAQEVYDDVVSRRDGDRVIVTGAVPEQLGD